MESSPTGSAESEFPEAGTVRRQKEELERRDSQRRDKESAAQLVRRVSQRDTGESRCFACSR